MITQRSDYDYVEIEDDILINGGILPVREDGGEGIDAPGVFRGEDVAFCLEAAHERARVAGTTRPTIMTVDKHIIGARWQEAITALVASSANACTAGTNAPYILELPAELPADVPLHYLYSKLYFDSSTLVSDANKFGSGEGFSQDPIRDVYRDITRLTMYEHNGTFSRSSDEYTATSGGGPHRQDSYARGEVVFMHAAVHWPNDSMLYGGWTEAIANIGRFQFEPSADVDPTHVGRYQLVIELQIDLTDEDASVDGEYTDPETTTKHYVWVQTEQGNALDCAQSVLGTIGRQMAITYHGGALPTHTTLPEGKAFVARVMVKSVRAAVYLDDHTDISDIPIKG